MSAASQLTARAREIGADWAAGTDARGATAALELAAEISPLSRAWGSDSPAVVTALTAIARGDLAVARAVEPHLDAQAILHQAGREDVAPAGSTWGVYAAHASRHHLRAAVVDGTWTLDGTKPWCSLAAQVSHAVITAHTSTTTRRAFAVDLRHTGVSHPPQPWVARGLAQVPSTSVTFEQVPAEPLGGDGWYLQRPGFSWGAVAVAAVWLGGAHALHDTLVHHAQRREPDQLALTYLGEADVALHAAHLALDDAARWIDATGAHAAPEDAQLLASRARALAAHAAERLVHIAGHALGPAPLTGDEEHARRVADLTVYVRQHHGERDLAHAGQLILDRSAR